MVLRGVVFTRLDGRPPRTGLLPRRVHPSPQEHLYPRIVQKSHRAVAHDSFRLAASPAAIQLFSPPPPQKQSESASARGAADSTNVSLHSRPFLQASEHHLIFLHSIELIHDLRLVPRVSVRRRHGSSKHLADKDDTFLGPVSLHRPESAH